MTHLRWTSRLAVLPAIVIGCAAFGGALAPAAHAAADGTWTTPKAGATISGSTVTLQCATSQSSVTFMLPTGNEAATVSNGVATGTFDSTKVVNGTVTLTASECNVLNMCDVVSEMVTVSNVAATPPPTSAIGTFSPASGSVKPGDAITLGGSGSASVSATIDSTSGSALNVTLPYTYLVPTGLAQGTHTLSLTGEQLSIGTANGTSAASTSASLIIVVPDTTPPVISKLVYPKTYFPVRDGYLDHFYAIFSANEASTATLVMYKSGKVVSSGTLPVNSTALVDLRAGDRLKPGTYQWQLIVTDLAGNVTKTPMRNVTADGRHLVSHPASTVLKASSIGYKNLSGSCSSVTKSGTTVVLASLSKCKSSSTDEYFDLAAADLFPVVKNAIDYGTLTLKITTQGTGVIAIFDFATNKFDIDKKLGNGTTTVKLSDLYVGYPKPELGLELVTAGGKRLTISTISISYTYKTLSKK